MNWQGDHAVLTSGREEYFEQRIVGIDTEGVVFGGYDNTIGGEDWTPEERRELAADMMRKWAEFGGFSFEITDVA